MDLSKLARPLSVIALQWSLALVAFIEAAFLAIDPRAIAVFHRTGLAEWVRLALAWNEMFAAVVFLIPRATGYGACWLLLVFVCAVPIHVLHGGGIGGLIVYGCATVVVALYRPQKY